MPDKALVDMILRHVPEDGSLVGNVKLKKMIKENEGHAFSDAEHQKSRDDLVNQDVLAKGGGKAGSVRRVLGEEKGDQNHVENPETSDTLRLEKLHAVNPQQTIEHRSRKQSPGRRSSKNEDSQIISYRYNDKRKNNPPVGLDMGRSRIENFIDEALLSGA